MRRSPLLAIVVVSSILAAAPPAAVAQGSWSAGAISAADLNGVAFTEPTSGWAVGAAGTIVRTVDGHTWHALDAHVSADLLGVDFVDRRRGWAVGAGDTVLRTSDGGRTWRAGSTGTGAELHGVDFVDARHGWAVGVTPTLVPVIAATVDGGATWTAQRIAPVGVGLLSISFLDPLRGMAVGFAGAAFRTTDGGRTWVPMIVGVGDDPTTVDTFQSVRVLSPTVAVIGSFEGFVYRTENGGLTWSARVDLGHAVNGLAAAAGSVVAAGDQGLVARSADEGATWHIEVSGTNADLRGAAAPSVSVAWVVGAGGAAARFADGAPVRAALHIAERRQSCTGEASIEWIHRAAGLEVDAAAGDLFGDGRTALVLAGPEGLRAVRPFAPTGRAVLWEVRFQTHFQQVVLGELDGDPRPEAVAASARTSPARDGITVVEAESGRVAWSRALPGGVGLVRLR
ncbi:MAG TPA: YCF48-related protein, partial [Actinomycetota bacterium]|nr:YCF48-related protein [Actinomycetota bacterium]